MKKNIKRKMLSYINKTTKRNIIIIAVVGVFLIILTLFLRNELATFVAGPELPLPPRPAFYFSPPSGEATPGESFNVDLLLNTDGLNINAVSSYIKYDPQKLAIQNIDRTSSVFNYEVESSIDSVNGIIKITAGQPGDAISNDTDDGFTGDRGKIATISLRAAEGAEGAVTLGFIKGLGDAPSVTSCKVKNQQDVEIFTCASRMILDDGLGTDKLALTNDGTYIIKIPPTPNYTLSVNKTGNGAGTVTSTPAGINCGAKCTQSYKNNEVVTLIASPDDNSVFGGWSGDADCADAVVTMDKDKTCSASFNTKPEIPPDRFSLDLIKTGEGTVTSDPTGINCGSDCSENYVSGTSVTLSAVPSAGWKLIGWHGVLDCQDGIVTMDQNKTCTAQFGPVELPPQADNKIKLKLELEGRKDKSLEGLKLEVRSLASGELIKTYIDLVVGTDGSVEINASDLTEDTYVVKLVLPGYLTHTLASVTVPDNLVIFTPPKFVAGNLYDKDNVINVLDAGVMNRRWGTSDKAADINQDGTVNTLDWGYVNRNWGKTGD